MAWVGAEPSDWNPQIAKSWMMAQVCTEPSDWNPHMGASWVMALVGAEPPAGRRPRRQKEAL